MPNFVDAFSNRKSRQTSWKYPHFFLFPGQMVEFANTVYGEPVNYVVSEGGTLGLSRGNKGFFAMGDLNREFDTGLPDGEYCDIISECQQKITVTIWSRNFPHRRC